MSEVKSIRLVVNVAELGIGKPIKTGPPHNYPIGAKVNFEIDTLDAAGRNTHGVDQVDWFTPWFEVEFNGASGEYRGAGVDEAGEPNDGYGGSAEDIDGINIGGSRYKSTHGFALFIKNKQAAGTLRIKGHFGDLSTQTIEAVFA